jgi:hypothetical protein
MARYIIIDAHGRATLLDDRTIQKETTALLASGQAFQVFEAHPLSVEISLKPAKAAKAVQPPPRRKAKAGGRKKAKKARKSGKAAKKAKTTGQKRGKPGRPRVNVGSCAQPGCSKRAKTRGLCSAHYQQHRRRVQAGKPGLIRGGVTTKKKKQRSKKSPAAKQSAKPATKQAPKAAPSKTDAAKS